MSELGALLQQARAYKGISLREAERATRISRQYLEAIESDDYAQLPPATYARGIVRNYAQYLGLDSGTALALFDARNRVDRRRSDVEIVPATSGLDLHSHWAPNFLMIAFMVLIAGIVFAWMYSAYFKTPEALPTQTSLGAATVTPVDPSILSVAPTPTATVPTVTAAGGGFATGTPIPSPTSTPTEEATATEEVADDTTTTDDTSTTEDTPATDEESATPGLEAPAIGEGSHTFVVMVTQDLWVQVTLDDATVFEDVIPAGGERIFYGESVAVTTGNAEFASVYVDGDQFPVGDAWDATFYWP